MSELARLRRENASLRKKLDSAIRREGKWKAQSSMQSAARKAAVLDRDAALKRLADQAPGVARVIAEIQRQGAAIEGLHAEIDALKEGQ